MRGYGLPWDPPTFMFEMLFYWLSCKFTVPRVFYLRPQRQPQLYFNNNSITTKSIVKGGLLHLTPNPRCPHPLRSPLLRLPAQLIITIIITKPWRRRNNSINSSRIISTTRKRMTFWTSSSVGRTKTIKISTTENTQKDLIYYVLKRQ